MTTTGQDGDCGFGRRGGCRSFAGAAATDCGSRLVRGDARKGSAGARRSFEDVIAGGCGEFIERNAVGVERMSVVT